MINERIQTSVIDGKSLYFRDEINYPRIYISDKEQRHDPDDYCVLLNDKDCLRLAELLIERVERGKAAHE